MPGRAEKGHNSSGTSTLEERIKQAAELAKAGSFQEALEILYAVDKLKVDAEVKYGIAYCLYKMRDYAQADPYARTASALNFGNATELVQRIKAKLRPPSPAPVPNSDDESAQSPSSSPRWNLPPLKSDAPPPPAVPAPPEAPPLTVSPEQSEA